jgi:hypothetical protein
MKPAPRLPLVFLFVALGASSAGATDAAPTPRDLQAAQCVAALETQTEALAQQVKAGNDASKAVLLERLIAGTAFIGDSYLHSKLSEAQAKALVRQAHEAQSGLPATELAARQESCAGTGSKLYAASNGVQQMVVQRLAKKRMGKLLGA